jgi:hypothetical protein
MIADLVVELHQTFDELDIAHAFGGALALNFYAEPRGTGDVDVNVSVPVTRADELVEHLGRQGFAPLMERSQWVPAGGVRVVRPDDGAIVDLFVAFDGYHQIVVNNAVRHPFPPGATTEIPFLAANDLVVMKLSFNRSKDWVDIEAMCAAGTPIDLDYVRHHLLAFKGERMHPRLSRLAQIVPSTHGSSVRPTASDVGGLNPAEETCGRWMPRARTPCGLDKDHSGHCKRRPA